MSKLCPYCAGKIRPGAKVCEHCGEVLVKEKRVESEGPRENASATRIDYYESKRVPSWVMYLLVGASLFCCYVALSSGCDKKEPDSSPAETRIEIRDHSIEEFG